MLPVLLVLAMTPAELVGFWHASPEVAAGYDASYAFRADGSWDWHTADGTCKAGVWERHGVYTLKGTTLTLREQRRKTYVGGRKATDEAGGCEMRGGKMVEKIHKKPKKTTVRLADCKAKDADANPEVACVRFGKLVHWRLSEDPATYARGDGGGVDAATFEEHAKLLTEMTDKVCACADRRCVGKVLEEANKHGPPPTGLSDEQTKTLEPIIDRLNKCVEKIAATGL